MTFGSREELIKSQLPRTAVNATLVWETSI